MDVESLAPFVCAVVVVVVVVAATAAVVDAECLSALFAEAVVVVALLAVEDIVAFLSKLAVAGTVAPLLVGCLIVFVADLVSSEGCACWTSFLLSTTAAVFDFWSGTC